MGAHEFLKGYTGKSHVVLTRRGNAAILLALKIAKHLGKTKVVVQDQGGWITYLQYPERLKMELVRIPTNYGVIDPNVLSKYLDKSSVLLVNSLSGYFAEQPMALLFAICRQKGALCINDASGSLGTFLAKSGDLIIGSFGEDKPVEVGYGGFLAYGLLEFSTSLIDDADFDSSKLSLLEKELKGLPAKLKILQRQSEIIKKDLAGMDLLHPESKGINVVVKCDALQKERVIKYCAQHGLEHTDCPRYIRANVEGVSVEVKRIRI
ncbi:MAG: DegT/DnrJ/EryC1/StrS family aminotransferase [Nanoarchaeota archaeon]|nr:DegT/DnrJ/EryC1/StrS family aminotransferase [Nanoarchaeota archaeon]